MNTTIVVRRKLGLRDSLPFVIFPVLWCVTSYWTWGWGGLVMGATMAVIYGWAWFQASMAAIYRDSLERQQRFAKVLATEVLALDAASQATCGPYERSARQRSALSVAETVLREHEMLVSAEMARKASEETKPLDASIVNADPDRAAPGGHCEIIWARKPSQ
ncbi:MAG: hypothetical protein WC222_12510 [Parachlamydiales bacterium]